MSEFEKVTGLDVETIADRADELLTEIADGAHYPCMGLHDVVRQRHGDNEELLVLLAGRLVLPFELDEDFAAEFETEDEVAEHIAGVVDLILPLVEAMSLEHSSARLRMLGLMDADEEGPELDDVQLAPFDHWPAPDTPAFRATLKLTNDTLVGCEIFPVDLGQTDEEIRIVLAGLRRDVQRRNALLSSLQEENAVCRIDELAVRAIELEGLSVHDAILATSGRVRTRLNERLRLFWREGTIHAIYNASDELSIVEDQVLLRGVSQNTAWRPRGAVISSLTTHPVFAAHMRIIEQERGLVEGWTCKVHQKVFLADGNGTLREDVGTVSDRPKLKIVI